MRYLYNNNGVLIPKFQNKADYGSNIFVTNFGRLTLVGHHSRPSVRPSVRQGFLKIGSLVSSDFVHDNSWPWYLVPNEARFLKKKLAVRIWAQGA